MSWTDSTATGRGWFGLRLEVEGWPHVWVTDSRITFATNLDSRTVYPGLQFNGMRISERADLKEAWVQCGGITARIHPSSSVEDTVNGFTRDANQVGTLLANGATPGIDYNDATWVTRPASLPSGYYHLGSEAVLWSGANLYRQRWGTQAQDHTMVFAEQMPNPVPIYNWPPTMEGRRANIYAYGTDDTMSGNGTIIWRGVVARPPRMSSDGVSWEIAIDPITKLFEQEVAASPVEYKIRGIYHSNQCPLAVAYTIGLTSLTGPVYVSGFAENESDWEAMVNSAVLSMTTAASNWLTVLEYSINGGVPVFGIGTEYDDSGGRAEFGVVMKDVLDGDIVESSRGNVQGIGDSDDIIVAYVHAGDASGEFTIIGTSERPPWGYPLPQARCMVGSVRFDSIGVYGPFGYKEDKTLDIYIAKGYPDDGGDSGGSWPSNRVYLESVAGLIVGMVLTDKSGEATWMLRITAINTTASGRYITVDTIGGGQSVYLSSDTVLVPVANYAVNGNWSDFMEGVVTQSRYANLGTTPFITASDVAYETWDDHWDVHPFNAYWKWRNYYFVHPTTVKGILAEEFKATGFMARIASDGRVDAAPMPFVAPQQSAVATITDDDILYPAEGCAGSWPRWEAQTDGLVNIANCKLGYNPISDEFDERYDYQVRMTQSIAEHKSGQKASADIAPKSTPGPGAAKVAAVKAAVAKAAGKSYGDQRAPSTETVTAMAYPYLRTLSEDYAVVTVDVPFTKFSVLVGDIVEVSCSMLPDGLGARGMLNRKGICIGREWNLDPEQSAMGKLTIWLPRNVNKTAGYCPTGRITSQSGSGTSWTLTCASVVPANLWYSEGVPPGAVDAGVVVKHFAVGDAISIVQVDATIPTVRSGTVTSVDALAGTIGVTLTASWTPSSTTWNITFRYDGSTFIARQQAYCWIADDDGERLDGSAARLFV